jgi:hypothetical protein
MFGGSPPAGGLPTALKLGCDETLLAIMTPFPEADSTVRLTPAASIRSDPQSGFGVVPNAHVSR